MSEKMMYELADELKELRDKKSELEYQVKLLNEEINDAEGKLIQEMTADEIQNFKRSGTTFTVVTKEYPAAVVERKTELYTAMKRRGFSHLFTINTNTLSATIKELKANNNDTIPKWLDGLIKVAEKTTIQLRK